MNVRKLQVVLSNSDRHFREMINSHPDAIVLQDWEEHFVLCNERYYQDQQGIAQLLVRAWTYA